MVLAEHYLRSGPLHFQANNFPVAQNDGPKADNEKITKICAAYYVKVVDASFPYFHRAFDLIFLEVIKAIDVFLIRDQDQRHAHKS